MKIRTGIGIDFHRLENGIPLRLGGVDIPSEKGYVAHSDGDALIHAICDAILGAAGLRDIGHYFPDTSDDYKNIDSRILLKKTSELITERGYSIENIDSVICLERPRISPHIDEMRKTLASILSIEYGDIAIKATTTEKLGFTGREEGIATFATVLISKKQ
ncbi:MAG: 2-C-methyl-D-erythritol 2,4-cyclodiphosphate synthase [Bacteroidales bacterium]|jgi:2-C-methyl-D-erythritol 2,4-cyclodiphosphate synthase|nr:2-C-methyl-D-erythritol 2,4-cyclodiphosphate synthase [Bacteroidales bacterium]